MERLTAGRLVMKLGKDEFLYCGADRFAPYNTRSPLHRYSIISRSAELFWEPPAGDVGFRMRPGEEKFYHYTKLMLSPKGRFLFVPSGVRSTSRAEYLLGQVLQYGAYELKTGEKRGVFLNLYEGKFFWNFLGWVPTDHAQAR
jgi:hypothetical protein